MYGVTSNGFIQLTEHYLDLTCDKTYHIPVRPTNKIVHEPKPGSAPFHEEGSCNTPSPLVETSQTKYAENVDIKKIENAITYFT
tara:strand:- start:29 stop:280 length:252 start_codon:yes stop_codon:yes gene_type:complete